MCTIVYQNNGLSELLDARGTVLNKCITSPPNVTSVPNLTILVRTKNQFQ